MLALCWHNMPAHHAFYYASIFDTGLAFMAAYLDHLLISEQCYVNITHLLVAYGLLLPGLATHYRES